MRDSAANWIRSHPESINPEFLALNEEKAMRDKAYEIKTAAEEKNKATQERIKRELAGESAVKRRYYEEEKAAADKRYNQRISSLREPESRISRLSDLDYEDFFRYFGAGGVVVGLAAFIILQDLFKGFLAFLGCLVLSAVVYGILHLIVYPAQDRSYSNKRVSYYLRLSEEREKANLELEKNLKERIAQHNREVENYYGKLKESRANLKPMADCGWQHFIGCLKKEASAIGDREQFLSFKEEIRVSQTGIFFQGVVTRYSDPRYTDFVGTKFDFKTERYTDLSKESECEALAAVLLLMLGDYIRNSPETKQGQIRHSKLDANVTIEFRMPNTRFTPARAIL